MPEFRADPRSIRRSNPRRIRFRRLRTPSPLSEPMAARAVPIHQAIIDPGARGLYYSRLTEMTKADFQVLDPENGTDF